MKFVNVVVVGLVVLGTFGLVFMHNAFSLVDFSSHGVGNVKVAASCTGRNAIPARYCTATNAVSCGQSYAWITYGYGSDLRQGYVPIGCENFEDITACSQRIGAGLDGRAGEMELFALAEGSCGTYTQYLCVTTPIPITDEQGRPLYTEYRCSKSTNASTRTCSGTVKVAAGTTGC